MPKSYKVLVETEEQSKAVQKYLFKKGFRWPSTPGHLVIDKMPAYIYVRGGALSFSEVGYISRSPVPTVTVDYHLEVKRINEAKELVELNGRTYLKSDLEAALDKLTPVEV